MSKTYIFGIVKYLPEQLQFLNHAGILAPNLHIVKDNTNGHGKTIHQTNGLVKLVDT
jgi:hypothetical protein